MEKDQIVLQDKIAEENQQKARLLQLQARVQETHQAKSKAASVEELRALDESAAYLQSRMTLARRALSLAGQERAEALDRTLKSKQSRDQIGLLLENGRRELRHTLDESERRHVDELVTSRYAMALRGV